MTHGWIRRILILLAALGLCVGMLFYSREKPQLKAEHLTLWYAETDCSPTAMESLLARCLTETGLQIDVTVFPNEVALGEAFENTMPDLLFCSHIRASQLDGGGNLSALPSSLPIPEFLSDVRPAAGTSFFPIGSRLPVLLVNTSLTTDTFANLESMLDASANSPLFVCDRWSELLYTQAASEGIQLSGIPQQDLENAKIAALYNQIALGVFRGSFVRREKPMEYVRQGLVPAALVQSSSLADIADENLAVRLLPLPEGAEAQYPAELMGFALLDGAETGTAEGFFRWLFTGRGADAALKAGLAPTMQASGGRTYNGFETLLLSLGEGGALFYPDADDPFVRNRESCESWLCETLDLLT